MKMNSVIITTLALFLALSGHFAYAEDKFDIEQYVIKKYFDGDAGRHQKAKNTGEARYCQKYVALKGTSWGRENFIINDGPSFFLNKNDGSVFSRCSGACWHPATPEQIDACKNKCPPKDLDCGDSCPTWLCAINNQDVLSVTRFIKQGQPQKDLDNGLLSAALKGNAELVEILLDSGANVNTQNRVGYSPLFLNISNSPSAGIVKTLIKAGADLTIDGAICADLKLCVGGKINVLEYARLRLKLVYPKTVPIITEIISVLQEAEKARLR